MTKELEPSCWHGPSVIVALSDTHNLEKWGKLRLDGLVETSANLLKKEGIKYVISSLANKRIKQIRVDIDNRLNISTVFIFTIEVESGKERSVIKVDLYANYTDYKLEFVHELEFIHEKLTKIWKVIDAAIYYEFGIKSISNDQTTQRRTDNGQGLK